MSLRGSKLLVDVLYAVAVACVVTQHNALVPELVGRECPNAIECFAVACSVHVIVYVDESAVHPDFLDVATPARPRRSFADRQGRKRMRTRLPE